MECANGSWETKGPEAHRWQEDSAAGKTHRKRWAGQRLCSPAALCHQDVVRWCVVAELRPHALVCDLQIKHDTL